MEREEKSEVVTSSERLNVGVSVVFERLATTLEDDPDCLDRPRGVRQGGFVSARRREVFVWLWSNRRLKHQTLFSDGALTPRIWRSGHRCRRDSARLGGQSRPQEQHSNRTSVRALRRFHGRQSIFGPRTPQDDGHDCIQHVATEHTNAAAALFSTDLTNGYVTSRPVFCNPPRTRSNRTIRVGRRTAPAFSVNAMTREGDVLPATRLVDAVRRI